MLETCEAARASPPAPAAPLPGTRAPTHGYTRTSPPPCLHLAAVNSGFFTMLPTERSMRLAEVWAGSASTYLATNESTLTDQQALSWQGGFATQGHYWYCQTPTECQALRKQASPSRCQAWRLACVQAACVLACRLAPHPSCWRVCRRSSLRACLLPAAVRTSTPSSLSPLLLQNESRPLVRTLKPWNFGYDGEVGNQQGRGYGAGMQQPDACKRPSAEAPEVSARPLRAGQQARRRMRAACVGAPPPPQPGRRPMQPMVPALTPAGLPHHPRPLAGRGRPLRLARQVRATQRQRMGGQGGPRVAAHCSTSSEQGRGRDLPRLACRVRPSWPSAPATRPRLASTPAPALPAAASTYLCTVLLRMPSLLLPTALASTRAPPQ